MRSSSGTNAVISLVLASTSVWPRTTLACHRANTPLGATLPGPYDTNIAKALRHHGRNAHRP